WCPHLNVVSFDKRQELWELEFAQYAKHKPEIYARLNSMDETIRKKARASLSKTKPVDLVNFSGRMDGVRVPDVVVTSYERLCRAPAWLNKIGPFATCTVDEGHRLKAGNVSNLWKALDRIPCVFRCLLTGTPVQNSITELWHLLKYLDEDNIPEQEDFLDLAAKAVGIDLAMNTSEGGKKPGRPGRPALVAADVSPDGVVEIEAEKPTDADTDAEKTEGGKVDPMAGTGAEASTPAEGEAEGEGDTDMEKKGETETETPAETTADKTEGEGEKAEGAKVEPVPVSAEGERETESAGDVEMEGEREEKKGSAKPEEGERETSTTVALVKAEGEAEGEGEGEIIKADDPKLVALKDLHALLSPYLLIRRHSDVFHSLPGKTEILIPVDLTPRQRSLYAATLRNARGFFVKDKNKRQTKRRFVSNPLMQLRKVTNHPALMQDTPAQELGQAILVSASAKLDMLPLIY
ncbi:hypothetical protein KIPB_008318, partial [Kipferlia bialata]